MKKAAGEEAGAKQETLQLLRERLKPSTVRLGRHEWRYIDTGASGPAVVLLPGSQGTCEVFFKPLLRLGRQLRLIAVDFPGDPDTAALANGVIALFDHLSLASANLVGSSLGSYVGQVVGSRYPDRVTRLLLGNAFLDVADVRNKPAYNPATISASTPEALKEQRLERLRGMADGELKAVLLDLVGRQSPENLMACALAAACAPLAPAPSLDSERILVLQCEDDTTITSAMKEAVQRRYASAQHVLLPGGGHYPHVIAADDYCAVLARFFSGTQ